MSNKPKFLWRPSEFGHWFAALGRKRKAELRQGIDDPSTVAGMQFTHHLSKWRKAKIRHHRWWQVYQPAFDAAYDAAWRDEGLTDRQAFKRARQAAEQAVVDAFPFEVTTTRAVRDAFDEHKE